MLVVWWGGDSSSSPPASFSSMCPSVRGAVSVKCAHSSCCCRCLLTHSPPLLLPTASLLTSHTRLSPHSPPGSFSSHTRIPLPLSTSPPASGSAAVPSKSVTFRALYLPACSRQPFPLRAPHPLLLATGNNQSALPRTDKMGGARRVVPTTPTSSWILPSCHANLFDRQL